MAQKPKYNPDYAKRLPDMFKNGEDVAEVAAALGVSRQAFYDWCKKYPKFNEAYELGKIYSEAWWSKLGRAGAAGKVEIQPTVWIFNMKNKFGWRDKPEDEEDEREAQSLNISFEVREPVSDVKVTNAKSK